MNRWVGSCIVFAIGNIVVGIITGEALFFLLVMIYFSAAALYWGVPS